MLRCDGQPKGCGRTFSPGNPLNAGSPHFSPPKWLEDGVRGQRLPAPKCDCSCSHSAFMAAQTACEDDRTRIRGLWVRAPRGPPRRHRSSVSRPLGTVSRRCSVRLESVVCQHRYQLHPTRPLLLACRVKVQPAPARPRSRKPRGNLSRRLSSEHPLLAPELGTVQRHRVVALPVSVSGRSGITSRPSRAGGRPGGSVRRPRGCWRR